MLSFVYPAALWLLLLLLPLWAMALIAPRRLSRRRFWLSLGLRTLLLTALIASLAGTQIVRRVDQLTTVFLVDSSDSVAPAARAEAEQFIQSALGTMPLGDQAAIVVFGENALVERAPSEERGLRRLESVPLVTRTNIGAALEIGLALLPAETQKRLVLLSDGGDNSGTIQTALEFARARRVPIDVVRLEAGTGADLARIDEVRAPSEVRKGQTISLEIAVDATAASPATLRIRAGNTVVSEQAVQLEVGRQTFRFPIKAETTGFTRYSAEIEVAADERRQNNVAAALVDVAGEPQVLVVEGTPGDATALVSALNAAQMNPAMIAPGSIPNTLANLATYDAVVLVNVAAGALPASAMNLLPAYVRDLGRGLVMIGGDRSFGIGSYARTPIEAALPVDMQVKDKSRRPDVALVFVLDKSGSMAACHCNDPDMAGQRVDGGVPKVDIGKDAVVQASALLQPTDQLGVVTFDSAAHWSIQTGKLLTTDEIVNALSGVTPEGTTNVREGLIAAKESLMRTEAKVKHVILLTDGWSSGSDNLDIARELRTAGVTLSTVAAGGGSAPYLEKLAQEGGGRYYPVENMQDVPQIFVDETIRTAGAYVIEQTFVPTLTGDSPIVRGLTDVGWPSLLGYNGTELKNAAQSIFQAPEGYPILAQWQYGLGRSVAWTSDLKGRWARDLVSWDQFGRFAAQMVAWTVPRAEQGLVSGAARIEGLNAIVTAQVDDDNGQPLVAAEVTGTLVKPDGTSEIITLKQVAPGQFQATVPSPATGSYLIQLAAALDGQPVAGDTIGLVVPYSPEYRQRESNPALLAALANATAGKQITDPAEVFRHDLAAVSRAQEIGLPLLLLVLLLLPLDIAVRRLGIRPSDIAAFRALLPVKASTATPAGPMLGGLQRAKQRAQTRIKSPAEPPPTTPSASPPSFSPPRMPRPQAERPTAAETDQFRTPPPPSTTDPEDTMARLRAARDRARRK